MLADFESLSLFLYVILLDYLEVVKMLPISLNFGGRFLIWRGKSIKNMSYFMKLLFF